MRRLTPVLIIGGLLAIAGYLASYFWNYFIPPKSEQAVRSAFQKLIDAESFGFDLSFEEAAENGVSVKSDGAIDISRLSEPISGFAFSFSAPNGEYSGNGEMRSSDGEAYVRFAKIQGLSGVKPESLKDIWAQANLASLMAVLKGNLFPGSEGTFTEEDLRAFKRLLGRHIPFRASNASWTEEMADGVKVRRYEIAFDPQEFSSFLREVKEAAKGAPLSLDENSALADFIAGLPPMTGEIMVAKLDGTLRFGVLTIRSPGGQAVLSVHLRDYRRAVKFSPPEKPRSLFELLSLVFGKSLSGQSAKLPFNLPKLVYTKNEEEKTGGQTARGEPDSDQDGLSNSAELFYGTNPFSADTDKDGLLDGDEVKNGSNPRGAGGLYDFGITK